MKKIFTDYEMMKAFITKLMIDSDLGNRRQIDPRHFHVLQQINKSCEHYLHEMKEEEEAIETYFTDQGYTEKDARKSMLSM